MNIYPKSMTGFGEQFYFIKQVSIFHDKIFNARAPMRFFDGDVKFLTDVIMDMADVFAVVTYPHNDEKILMARAQLFPELLAKIFEQLRIKHPNRKVATIEFTETGPKLVEKKDFNVYGPSLEIQSEAFVFETTEEGGGFPTIYLMDKSQRIGPGKDTFPIFAMTSHELADPAGLATTVGKKFVYMLYNSYRHGEFIPETPDFGSIDFPTRGTFTIPDTYNTEALKKFADKVYCEHALKENGLDLEAETTEDEIEDSSKNSSVNTIPQLKDFVLKQIREGFSVALFDILNLGLNETLSLIDDPTKIIDVNLDMAGFARKACLFEGRMHYIPVVPDDDPEDFFGISGDVFQAHVTNSTFPSK